MAYRTRVDDYCTGSDEIGQELSNGDLKTRRKDPIYGMSSDKGKALVSVGFLPNWLP